MRRNVSDTERLGSILGGAALAYLAMRQSKNKSLAPALAAAGYLIARGASGYCPVNAAIGRNSRVADTKRDLAGPRGIHVREQITVNRPVGEAYQFWRRLQDLPRFMRHLERVDVLDEKRSHWVARGPLSSVEWDAEIINEIPNQLIAWRSLENADVTSAGSVNFHPAPNGGTQIVVDLQYAPPAGKVGALIASLLGEEPSQQIAQDLQRAKHFIETGTIPPMETSAHVPLGRPGRIDISG
jgi:uncharacterized membrane protein